MKEQQLVERPREPEKLKLLLDSQLRSGELVLELHQLAAGYTVPGSNGRGTRQHVLVRADELELHRGERVALLGPNGSGKTTLLRTLLQQQPALAGGVRLGHNVVTRYYAQGHDTLNMEATVLQELLRVSPGLGEARARTVLGSFLFSGDDVFKRVGDLSGGERSRVALAQLMLVAGNLLVLDEPTNHLDIGAREALEAMLKDYNGSMLFVSHDRHFIDALADKLWIIRDGQLHQFLGNYSDYTAHQAAQRAAAEQADRQQTPAGKAAGNGRAAGGGSAQADRQRKKELARLEAQVETLEQELARVNDELQQASTAQDVARVAELGQRYTELEAQLERCYHDWETLAT
jgi:ATP-binding cassette subfamily F protein 3